MDYTDNLQSVLPVGLAFGMAMDEQAINHYGRMTEYRKSVTAIRLSKNMGGTESQSLSRLCLNSLFSFPAD